METNFLLFLGFFFIIMISVMVIALIQLISKVVSDRSIDAIKNYYNVGDFDSVIRLSTIILSRDPNNAECHYYIGEAYFAKNMVLEAINEYKIAEGIAAYSDSFTEQILKNRLISAYEAIGNINEALNVCLSITQKYPDNYFFFLKQGGLFEKINAKDSALSSYLRVLELDPINEEALLRSGVLSCNSKNYIDAETYLTKYEAINKNNGEVYYYLGTINKASGDRQKALDQFELAASKSYDDDIVIKSLYEKGFILTSIGKMGDAAREFEKIIDRAPSSLSGSELMLNVRYSLGNCYEISREIEKAIDQWNIVFSFNPEFKDVASRLGEYDEFRKNDYFKEFFTATEEQFVSMSKDIIGKMGFYSTEYNVGSNGYYIEFYALDLLEKNKKDIKKSKKLIYIYRVSSPIDESTTRKVYATMHENNIVSATIITTSTFSPPAVSFARERPIELIDKTGLYEMMTKSSS